MAYSIQGTIHHIGQVQNIETKKGTLQRCTVIVKQRRFDQQSGQEYEPNYPALDFSNKTIEYLSNFKVGDSVIIKFDVSGALYERDGQVRSFTSLRAFSIQFVSQLQPAQQSAQQPAQQPQSYSPRQTDLPF